MFLGKERYFCRDGEEHNDRDEGDIHSVVTDIFANYFLYV